MSTESKYYEYNPEKRNIFIEISSARNNMILGAFAGFFLIFASHASAVVEVFLRKKFGERYITLAQSIGLFIVMNLVYDGLRFLSAYIFQSRLSNSGQTFLFIFSLIFLGFAIKHRLEIKKYGTAYDFKRFSKSDGEIYSFWYEKVIGKKLGPIKISYYTVVTLLEPLLVMIVGLVLYIFPFTRAVGILLIFCGFVFGVRNFAKAQAGRNWVLDNIDKKISNEMKYDVFIGRKPKSETKGVYLPIEFPEDEQTRLALYKAVEGAFTTDNDIWENDNLDKEKQSSGGMGNG